MDEGSVMIDSLFSIGPVTITGTVVTTWLITGVLWIAAWLISRNLKIEPGPVQAAVEGIVMTIEDAVREVSPQHARHILPFIYN